MERKYLLGCFAGLIFGVFVVWGCSTNNPVAANSNGPGKVSMMAKYSNQPITGLAKAGSIQTVDSIIVTRARVVLKDVKLEGEEEDHESKIRSDSTENDSTGDEEDEVEFKSQPFVLDLDLTGSIQQVTISDVPFGTYDNVKFKIHRVNQSDIDSLSTDQQATFADFLSGNGYSIIIEGTVFQNGQSTPFTFKSTIDAELEMPLSPPLVVDQNNTTANITMELSSSGWFRASDGTLFDPNDPNNAEFINDNLQNFIRVYKDNDRDGEEDD